MNDRNVTLSVVTDVTDTLSSMSRGGGDHITPVREVLCFN